MKFFHLLALVGVATAARVSKHNVMLSAIKQAKHKNTFNKIHAK